MQGTRTMLCICQAVMHIYLASYADNQIRALFQKSPPNSEDCFPIIIIVAAALALPWSCLSLGTFTVVLSRVLRFPTRCPCGPYTVSHQTLVCTNEQACSFHGPCLPFPPTVIPVTKTSTIMQASTMGYFGCVLGL